MIIPPDSLSTPALQGLIEQYITQVHGVNDVEDPLVKHCAEVERAVREGRLVVVFSQVRQQAWLAPPATNNR